MWGSRRFWSLLPVTFWEFTCTPYTIYSILGHCWFSLHELLASVSIRLKSEFGHSKTFFFTILWQHNLCTEGSCLPAWLTLSWDSFHGLVSWHFVLVWYLVVSSKLMVPSMAGGFETGLKPWHYHQRGMQFRCLHLSQNEELLYSFTENSRNDFLKYSLWQRGWINLREKELPLPHKCGVGVMGCSWWRAVCSATCCP